MDPVILASAHRHGVDPADMLHAYRNPMRVIDFDDLLIVVGGDRRGKLLEIGVSSSEEVQFIVHAMPARRRFIEG